MLTYGRVDVRSVGFTALQPDDVDRSVILGPVEIIGDNGPVASALEEQLVGSGVEARRVASFGSTHTGIVATALGRQEPEDLHWTVLEQSRAFRSAGGKRLIFLQLTGGTFEGGQDGGWAGGIASLAKTAAREWTDIKVQVVDVAVQEKRPDEIASNILRAAEAGQLELGVDDKGRLIGPLLSDRLDPIADKPDRLGGVWLVTGGARGVTAACIRETAQRAGGTFVLLGRSSLIDWPTGIAPTDSLMELRRDLAVQAKQQARSVRPVDIDRHARAAMASQEIRENIRAINAAGAEVIYKVCDLMDAVTLPAIIADIRSRHGAITGLVHGAGVLADRLIMETRRDEFERVFQTKSTGLKTVLECLDLSALRHVGLFSSAAARYGNVGQVSYAMANDVLNRVARHLRVNLPDARVKSFNWGPWEGGMVDETLARHFEAQGIGLIPVATGACIFADQMLLGDNLDVELLIGDEWTV